VALSNGELSCTPTEKTTSSKRQENTIVKISASTYFFPARRTAKFKSLEAAVPSKKDVHLRKA
jgi:hypothetical protein